MKKRILPVLLILCLLTSLLSVSAVAAEGGTAAAPGDTTGDGTQTGDADTGDADTDPDVPVAPPGVTPKGVNTLKDLYESAANAEKGKPVYIYLTESLSDANGSNSGSSNMIIPGGAEVTIDLYGSDLVFSPPDYSRPCNITVLGTLTIKDSKAAEPPKYGSSYDPDAGDLVPGVAYASGRIVCRSQAEFGCVLVSGGGKLILDSGSILAEADNSAAVVLGGDSAEAAVNNGYASGRRAAVLLTGAAAKLTVAGGVLEGDHAVSDDTFSNPTDPDSSTTAITVSGGELLGGSCGIYHSRGGDLTIKDGKIRVLGQNSPDGIGIQISRGNLTMEGGEILLPLQSGSPSQWSSHIRVERGIFADDTIDAINKDISIAIKGEPAKKYTPDFPEGGGFYLKAETGSDGTVTYTAAPNTLVTFDFNCDMPDGSSPTRVLSTDSNGILPSWPRPYFSRGGYYFAGWGELANSKDPVDQNRKFEKKTTLYAIWKPVQVTFYDKPDINPDSKTVLTVNDKNQIDPWPAPTRYGQTFVSWNLFDPKGEKISSEFVFDYERYGRPFEVYAQWRQARVTFKLDANASANYKTLNPDGITGRLQKFPDNPGRAGCTFRGWTLDPKTNTLLGTDHVYSGDATLYAVWTELPKVTFRSGVPSGQDTVVSVGEDGKLPQMPNSPSQKGQVFLGWFTPDGKEVTADTVFAADTAVTAKWLKLREVRFDLNYKGAASPSSRFADKDTNLLPDGQRPKPNRNGYTFTGWYNKAEGGTAVDSAYVFRDDVTVLYAYWQAIQVTFNSNFPGGPAAETKNVNASGQIASSSWPKPTRPGYTLEGWYTNAEGGTAVAATKKFTASATLYAHWKKNPALVTFDPNCSGAENVPAKVSAGADGTIKWPSKSPTRSDGYIFEDWFFAPEGGTPIDRTYVFQADTTVLAHWLRAPAVTFDANHEDAGSPVKRTVGPDWKLTQADWPAEPQRTGWYFTGWYTEKEGGSFKNRGMEFRTDTTLYAHWEKKAEETGKSCTVTLDPQGGTLGEAGPLTTGKDGRLPALPGAPTRTGYDFAGWYTEKEGGDKVSADTVFTEDSTIYAHWTAKGTTPENPGTPDDPNGSGSSGGGRHRIRYPDRVTGGTFDVSDTRAREGDRVTIELSPRSSYELDRLEVIDLETGRALRLTEHHADEFSFTMPDSEVEIEISYQRRDTGGGYYVPEKPVTPMTGWYYQNGRIYTAAGELVSDRTLLTRDMLLSIFYNREGGGAEGCQVWATNSGIVPNYYEGGFYGTDKPLTRDQTALLLFRYAGYKGYNTAQRSAIAGYADYDQIRPIAQTAMSWARAAGVMNGTGAATLSPTATLNCGQACVLLSRFTSNVSWGW